MPDVLLCGQSARPSSSMLLSPVHLLLVASAILVDTVRTKTCFTQLCDSHSRYSECLKGSWACDSTEYCEVTTHQSVEGNGGWVTLTCEPMFGAGGNLAQCQRHLLQNDPTCNPHELSQQCTWCCTDAGCLHNLNTLYPNHYTTTTTTAEPEVCLDLYTGNCAQDFPALCHVGSVAEICMKTCGHCPEICEDHCAGTCCEHLKDQCDDPVIHNVCRKSCGFCEELRCEDKFTGDCAVVFAGRCSENTVKLICQESCGLCDTEATETVVECEDEYIGNCEMDFPGQCNDSAIRTVCKRTCGTCHESSTRSSAWTTTATTANTKQTPTALPTFNISTPATPSRATAVWPTIVTTGTTGQTPIGLPTSKISTLAATSSRATTTTSSRDTEIPSVSTGSTHSSSPSATPASATSNSNIVTASSTTPTTTTQSTTEKKITSQTQTIRQTDTTSTALSTPTTSRSTTTIRVTTASVTSAVTSPPSTTVTTITPTSTSISTHAPEIPCEDLYRGDCLQDLGNECDSAFVVTVCRKSCNLC